VEISHDADAKHYLRAVHLAGGMRLDELEVTNGEVSRSTNEILAGKVEKEIDRAGADSTSDIIDVGARPGEKKVITRDSLAQQYQECGKAATQALKEYCSERHGVVVISRYDIDESPPVNVKWVVQTAQNCEDFETVRPEFRN
jgi:hypothetical protein